MIGRTGLKKIGDIVLRERFPQGEGPHKLLILLHGWTGDENSMWIFISRIPEDYLVIAPRGLWRTPLGGYGWRKNGSADHSRALDFQPAIDVLSELISSLEYPGIEDQKFSLMGFSEGAALSFTMALKYPERFEKLAGLSGFLPSDLAAGVNAGLLNGKKIFVAHGRKDELVSVDKARSVVRVLKHAGAEVVYCEEDVGHKLSAGCFRGLGDYFRDSH
jgi:phospholipase/carboxylesterase